MFFVTKFEGKMASGVIETIRMFHGHNVEQQVIRS